MTEANLDTKALLEKYLRDSHVLNLATAVNNRPSNRDVFYLTPDELTDYIYTSQRHATQTRWPKLRLIHLLRSRRCQLMRTMG